MVFVSPGPVATTLSVAFAVPLMRLSAAVRLSLTLSLPAFLAVASVGTLIREEPRLRHRMAIGFRSMASFSGLWTVIAFLLSGPQYGYGEGVIGLFALAGVAGAAMASFAGRLADRGHVAAGTRAGPTSPAR